MPAKTRSTHSLPYHHGDLRYALIQAGLELLAEGGAQALDLRKVARRAGVSHAAPYRHFADKQTLIAAITEEGFHWLADQIQAAVHDTSNGPFAELLAVAHAYVSFAEAHPWLMREMFSSVTIERETYESLQTASKAVYRLYVDMIRRGQERGEIIDGDPAALAGVYWAVLHGLATLIIDGQMGPYADGPEGSGWVTHYTLEVLYGGLARR